MRRALADDAHVQNPDETNIVDVELGSESADRAPDPQVLSLTEALDLTTSSHPAKWITESK